MTRKLLILILLGLCAGNYSCKKKTCPAYQEDMKEEYKIKNQKRKKAKLY